MSYSMKLPTPASWKRFGALSVPPLLPFRYWIHIGCAQPLMILRRLCVQPTQPWPGVGVGPVLVGEGVAVAVARGGSVAVAVARGAVVEVGVAVAPCV